MPSFPNRLRAAPRLLLSPVELIAAVLRWMAGAAGITGRHRWLVRQLARRGERDKRLRRDVRVIRSQLAEALEQAREERQTLIRAVRVLVDREPDQRDRLAALREDPAYELAYSELEPLVSIVVPTFDNHRLLRERALPSALNQTYPHLEVIVVGDAAHEEAARVVAEADDPRAVFHNLGYRGPYPDDPIEHWLVAGVPPYNEAVRRAAGSWIAPLDDDDAFTPDHVERLLSHARAERAELAYGEALRHLPDGTVLRFGRFPPEHSHFQLQASIYHRGVARIFELELADAFFHEPSDWSVCRRMLRCGVRMSMLQEEVVHYYPSRAWAPPDEKLRRTVRKKAFK
jgi:hypothetical protein